MSFIFRSFNNDFEAVTVSLVYSLTKWQHSCYFILYEYSRWISWSNSWKVYESLHFIQQKIPHKSAYLKFWNALFRLMDGEWLVEGNKCAPIDYLRKYFTLSSHPFKKNIKKTSELFSLGFEIRTDLGTGVSEPKLPTG